MIFESGYYGVGMGVFLAVFGMSVSGSGVRMRSFGNGKVGW